MFEMPLKYLTRRIVEPVFKKDRAAVTQALHIAFDVRMYDYSLPITENTSVSASLHFLFYAKYCAGSRTPDVFSGISDNFCARVYDVKEWRHDSSHDTSTYEFNRATELYFSFAEELNTRRANANLPAKAPKDFDTFVDFQMFSEGLYSWVPVMVEKDPTDSYNYRRIIKVL